MQPVAETLTRHFGFRDLLVIGDGSAEISAKVRLSGAIVESIELDLTGPSSAPLQQALNGLGSRTFKGVAVILPGHLHGGLELEALMPLIAQKTVGGLMVVLSGDDGVAASGVRKTLENLAFDFGFRKHPGYYRVCDYQSLQQDSYPVVSLLEKINPLALKKYSLGSLQAERDLHMDMLRESGSRSDAHVFRYDLAARYVRPGDRVLDAACGLGYGSHVLARLSRAAAVVGYDASGSSIKYARINYGGDAHVSFREGFLPQCLAKLEDGSVDCIVSFETLEHVENPRAVLAEFRRVLTPGGRIICSVPHDWTDETGVDPNPYHFHAYDLNAFIDQLGAEFEIETLFAQTADRVKKPNGAPGEFVSRHRELRVLTEGERAGSALEAEWLLGVAMRPVNNRDHIQYLERLFSPAEAAASGSTLSIARDYDNPWLFRALITIGFRVEPADVRERLSILALNESRYDSADRGALLCVAGYAGLMSQDGRLATWLIDAMDDYLAITSAANPTVLRWQVSIGYMRALIALSEKDRATAAAAFEKVLKAPILQYSAALLTKAAQAAFRLGCMKHAEGDDEAAVAIWTESYRSISHAISRFLSDTHAVAAPFVMYETGETLSLLGRISAALSMIDEAVWRPAPFSAETSRDSGAQIQALLDAARQEDAGRRWLSAQIQELLRVADEKDCWIRALTEGKDFCEAQWRHAEAHLSELNRQVTELQNWNHALEEGKAWLEAQLASHSKREDNPGI